MLVSESLLLWVTIKIKEFAVIGIISFGSSSPKQWKTNVTMLYLFPLNSLLFYDILIYRLVGKVTPEEPSVLNLTLSVFSYIRKLQEIFWKGPPHSTSKTTTTKNKMLGFKQCLIYTL